MSTEALPTEVFAVDINSQFHPIRLPYEAFAELHRDTLDSLREFVKSHRERFPQGPPRRKPRPR